MGGKYYFQTGAGPFGGGGGNIIFYVKQRLLFTVSSMLDTRYLVTSTWWWAPVCSVYLWRGAVWAAGAGGDGQQGAVHPRAPRPHSEQPEYRLLQVRP